MSLLTQYQAELYKQAQVHVSKSFDDMSLKALTDHIDTTMALMHQLLGERRVLFDSCTVDKLAVTWGDKDKHSQYESLGTVYAHLDRHYPPLREKVREMHHAIQAAEKS